ncbi:MAG TPA: MBL fold metallo-hydrolase [Patescibacteria group bacterium]|nr:MBL fold metallo-hydrolase [Patescibacteria group bacterium]
MASQKKLSCPRRGLTRRRRWRFLALLAGMFLGAWTLQRTEAGSTFFVPDARLRVWVFDVGQGDAILVEAPTGERILVDAGPDTSLLPKLGSILPPWDRRIDLFVLTHPHMDHVGGALELLKRYKVGAILETDVFSSDPFIDAFEAMVEKEGARRVFARGGQKIIFGDVHLDVVAPDQDLRGKKMENVNNASVVLFLTYGQTSVLLTGDAAFEEETDLFSDFSAPIDVLKVAHHGSVTSTSPRFLSVTRPSVAIISVGTENDYGHPHPVTLARLNDLGSKILRTDFDGDVLIVSDGGEPKIRPRPLAF